MEETPIESARVCHGDTQRVKLGGIPSVGRFQVKPIGEKSIYVFDGGSTVTLDGVEHKIHCGSLVHIPSDVVHSARGKVWVLIVGIPDISDADCLEPPAS